VSVNFFQETPFFPSSLQDVSFVEQVLHVLLVEPLSFCDTQNQTTLQSYSPPPRTSKSSSTFLITYHPRIQETGSMLQGEYSYSSPSPPSTNIMTPNNEDLR